MAEPRRRRRRAVALVTTALVAAGLLALIVARPSPTPRRQSIVGPRFFVIGVFDQPSYSFAKWKARGINTIISFQSLSGTVPYRQWRAQLGQAGLYAIRAPEGDPRIDARDPRLLAFLQPDEPDLNGAERGQVVSNYRQWHERAPQEPVFQNYSGGTIMDATASQYLPLLRNADWISNDLYPIAGFGAPQWLDGRQPGANRIAQTLSKLSAWSGGKPQFQIVEASPAGLPGHGAATIDGDQLRGTVWNAVLHGVSGVIYFPLAIGPSFSFDAAPPDVVFSMTTVNAELARLSPVLLQPNLPDPPSVPPPFERAQKRYRGVLYTFTLNFSPVTEALDGHTYAPYQMTYTTG